MYMDFEGLGMSHKLIDWIENLGTAVPSQLGSEGKDGEKALREART